jgi:hypothetical protein
VLGLDLDQKADKAKAKNLLKLWIKTGALEIENRPDASRRDRDFIVPGVKIDLEK